MLKVSTAYSSAFLFFFLVASKLRCDWLGLLVQIWIRLLKWWASAVWDYWKDFWPTLVNSAPLPSVVYHYSVSLCYWVHYFSVAFEKMTSLRKYTRGSVWLFVVVEGIPMKWSYLRNVCWSTPWFGIWVVEFPVDLSLRENSLASLCSWGTLWCMCDMNARWSEVKQNPNGASDKPFCSVSLLVWLVWPSQI